MNPISSLTGVVIHPVRTAGFVAGLTIGVASGSMRTAGRLISKVAEHAPGLPAQTQASSSEVPSDMAPSDMAASDMAPVEAVPTTPAITDTAAAEAPAKVAPSARAAVVAPALGVPESEVLNSDDLSTPSAIPTDDEEDLDTEPLLDPATAKAVASEADVLQRAADVNKG